MLIDIDDLAREGGDASGVIAVPIVVYQLHIERMRAPTSMRIWLALRSLAEALTFGQVAVSKNCSSVAGMKRVREE